MGILGTDYEVRLHRADGHLSIVMVILATSDRDAKNQAQSMLRDSIVNAHVWRDGRLVDSLYRLN